MTDKIVNEICNTFFHTLPTKIIRNNVGLAGYVYTVQICGDKYVLKISDDKNIISGSTYWLDKMKYLDISTPKVITENTSTSPYYFIMTFISGKDLGIVYSKLSKDQKKNIAKRLINYQQEIKKLPMARGFGSLNAYEDYENLFNTWEDFILSEIKRAENGIKENNIFPTEYVSKVRDLIPDFREYFSTIKPQPFLDDVSTKNVLIYKGKISGIIDLDWITFGDQLYFLSLTTMALLSMKADLDYIDYLKDEMNLNKKQEKVTELYVLIFCIIFMSEKGTSFNKNTPISVTNHEKNHLIKIFDNYYEKLTATKTLFAKLKKGEDSAAKNGWLDPADVRKMVGL